LRLTDDQRRRLAAKAKGHGRKLLANVATNRDAGNAVALAPPPDPHKYDGSGKRHPGRPRTVAEIEELVVQMAPPNRDWGYRRIQGAISNLGHTLARSTIADILARHDIEPAPERNRKTTWKEFLTQHWELIVAADFFTIEVWTVKGLQRFIVLFFIELSTRRVEIAGISSAANRLWMSQVARNLTDSVDGLVTGKRYLIHDRDPLFTDEFLTCAPQKRGAEQTRRCGNARACLRTVTSASFDLARFVQAAARSRTALAAENLFLRKQLALFQERKVRPRRANDSTRWVMP
jgi:hypothetical protein